MLGDEGVDFGGRSRFPFWFASEEEQTPAGVNAGVDDLIPSRLNIWLSKRKENHILPRIESLAQTGIMIRSSSHTA